MHGQDARSPPVRQQFLSCRPYVKVVASFYLSIGQPGDSNQVNRELRLRMIASRTPSAKAAHHPLLGSGMIPAMNAPRIGLHHLNHPSYKHNAMVIDRNYLDHVQSQAKLQSMIE